MILSKENYMQRLVSLFSEYNAGAAFFVEKVKDPKKYGVVAGDEIEKGVYHAKMAIEKPSIPPSNLAIVAIYAFKPAIYQAIEQIKPGVNNEIQLTDAIQLLIDQGHDVYGLELKNDEKRIDIGNPASYEEAFTKFRMSHH
jgi:dTDP-glucose pyrophosphorylase